MRGNVIAFDPDTNTGAISGHDGKRYDFVAADWHDRRHPAHGDVVDFAPADQRATQVYLLEQEYVQPSLGEFLFSIRGRISRSQLWLKWIVPVVVVYVVLGLIARIGTADDGTALALIASILTVLFALFTIWPGHRDQRKAAAVRADPECLADDRAVVSARYDRQQSVRPRSGSAGLGSLVPRLRADAGDEGERHRLRPRHQYRGDQRL